MISVSEPGMISIDDDTVTPELRELMEELNAAWKKAIKPTYITIKQPTICWWFHPYRPKPNIRNDN